jgi:hypothetical protein
MDDKKYVRARWERAEECPRSSSQGKTWCISLGGKRFTRANVPEDDAPTAAAAWHEARVFTFQREEEVRRVEEEIDWLRRKEHLQNVEDAAIWKRVLAREQAELADLKRGMTL